MNPETQMEPNQSSSSEKVLSRRRFLANAAYVVGGAIVGGVIGNLLPNAVRQQEAVQTNAGSAVQFDQALMHFNRDQFQTVEAAVERIFPKDENGPGAKELGVAYYIDHQLAGEWGVGGREYRMGPFYPGEKTQGYQGRLNRREIFQIGIKGLQDYSLKTYQKRFIDLTPEEQDAVLTSFEKDEVALTGLSSAYFFSLLRSATLEGVYSDPLYGGNRNMEGWRMKKYPGDQMSYIQVIESENFIVMKPRSLRDHQ